MEKIISLFCKGMSYQSNLLDSIKKDDVNSFISIIKENNIDINDDISFENENNKLIMITVSYSAIKIISYLLTINVNINVSNKIGATIFHILASTGNIEILNMLLEDFKLKHHKDIYGNHFVHIAVKCGYIEFLEFIVHCLNIDINTKKLGNNKTPLIIAIEQGNIDMINTILDLGCNLNMRDSEGNTAFMKMLQYHNKFPLSFEYKFMDLTNSLYLKDKDNKNLLHLLVCNNKIQLIRLVILSCKSCIYRNLMNSTDNKGNTPLYYAYELNLLDIAEVLISAYTDTTLSDKNKLLKFNTSSNISPDKIYRKIYRKISKLLKFKQNNQ